MAVRPAPFARCLLSFELPKGAHGWAGRPIYKDVAQPILDFQHKAPSRLLVTRPLLYSVLAMPQTSPTRVSSVSSDVRTGGASSPCAGAAQRLRSRRPVVIPAAYRDMISLDPLIGPTLNARVEEVERRRRFRSHHTPPCAASKGIIYFICSINLSDAGSCLGPSSPCALSAPAGVHHRDPLIVGKLRTRIQRLERSKGRLQEQLQDAKESLQDARREAESAQTELLKVDEAACALVKAEERVKILRNVAKALRNDGDKFRRWWLTEYHSLQVVLKLVPNPEDVEAISASAGARFEAYSK